MIDYVQLRYHCQPCGIYQSVVLAPCESAAWACPACGSTPPHVEHCIGKATAPAFGFDKPYTIGKRGDISGKERIQAWEL